MKSGVDELLGNENPSILAHKICLFQTWALQMAGVAGTLL